MMTRSGFLRRLGVGAAAMLAARHASGKEKAPKRPNILWLSAEDIGPHLGCYGDPHAITPRLDQLAAAGVRCTHAFTAAPVCAPNRSSIITSVYASTLGAQHMRSGGEGLDRSIKPQLPESVPCLPEVLREHGYYCTNNAKEDYNFAAARKLWDESSGKAHWKNRPGGVPFFAVFNFKGSHEGSVRANPASHARNIARLREDQLQDPGKIAPPPYHPDTPEVRRQWANYYENITALDYWVGSHLDALEEAGLAEDTIVVFWSDHGAGLPRNKRWNYDSGTQVPLIVHAPPAWRDLLGIEAGSVDDRLVSSLDLAPTTLTLAGAPVPESMMGRTWLGDAAQPRQYVHCIRDRMDERYDMVRAVRDERFRYIRNYMPFLPYDQYMNTAEQSPVKQALHQAVREGSLPPGAAWMTRGTKPIEELYDLDSDPHELNNLAGQSSHRETLERLRAAHEAWRARSRDTGLIPEPELVALAERFGTRYAIYEGMARERPAIWENLYKTADAAGKWCVEPGPEHRETLRAAALDPAPSIRWWAFTGLAHGANLDAQDAELLTQALEDESLSTAAAAAHGLLRHETNVDAALELLVRAAASEREWVRLHAVTALDRVGELARPAIPALRQAREDRHNKYVVRVANHALNVLLGENNQVR